MVEENNRLTEAYNLATKDVIKDSIGLLQEHTLHRVLKFYISLDECNHEHKVNKMYADVKIDNKIFEIQTKSFNALRKKLDIFLEEYDVTIVYPVALNKNIYLTNDFGELLSNKKSPKHGNALDILWELYKIKQYLLNNKLHFKIIMLDIDEFRVEKEKTWKCRKGFERENQIPRKINRVYDIKSHFDFKSILLEYDFPEVFTSKAFSKVTKLTIKKATTALNVLTYLNVVERIGKEKNSYLYKIV